MRAAFRIRGGQRTARPTLKFQAGRVAPARQPLEQFGVGQNQRVRVAQGGIALRVGNPLDEFPVGRRKQLLLMGGADDEVNHFAERARLLAGARARQKELHGQAITRRLLLVRLQAADDAQDGARRVEQRHGGRRQPVFQFLHELLFLFGLLGLGKTVEAGVRLQFGRHGALGPQKQKGEFFQARLALGIQQTRPPVRVGKILARKREFFEIILQQQPRTLRIRAGGEAAQDVLALVDGRLRIRKFAAQIGERAVGLRQHFVMRVVFCRARRPRAVPVSD